MELDLLIDNLNLEYYKSLQYCFNENGNHLLWLNEHIEKLTNKNINSIFTSYNLKQLIVDWKIINLQKYPHF